MAILTTVGKVIGDARSPLPAGYRAAISFLTGSGEVEPVGVEGAAGSVPESPGPSPLIPFAEELVQSWVVKQGACPE